MTLEGAEMRPDDVLALVTRPGSWARVRVFGSVARGGHLRRRVDTITLAVQVLALVTIIPAARTTDGVEAAIADVVGSLPTIVAPIAAVPYDLLAVWAIVLIVVAVVRWHLRLALALVAAVPIAVATTYVVNGALGLGGDARGLVFGAPQLGVPIQLVLSLAMASIAARELSRPFRTTTHRLAIAAAVGALLLPVGTPLRVLCAVVVAGVTTGLVRLAFGTPETSVSARDVREGLRDLGVASAPVDQWPDGASTAVGVDGTRLSVRTMGRDEWDSQLMVTVWRFLWYRRSGSALRLSPRLQLEHQAMQLLLAAQHGVQVTPVVAVGVSRVGDAMLATRVDGGSLASRSTGASDAVDDSLLGAMWDELAALHAAGISHGAIDPRAIMIGRDGTIRLGRFEQSEPVRRISQIHADRAQLLVTTALTVGPARAIGVAVQALDSDEDAVAPLVAHLQPAALDDDLRRSTRSEGLSLDELRTATAAAAEIEVPDLQKIWRVTWGSLVRLGVLGAVGYLLISQLAEIGWDSVVDAVTAASVPILLAALVLGQVPRIAQAGSLQTASPTPVPLFRVTKLVFATSFVNLAVPSTAARVATSIRFFQRSGTTAAGAVSAGALDAVFGFAAQIVLLGGFLVLGLGTLGFGGESSVDIDPDTVRTIVLVLVALLVLAVIAVLVVAPLRRRVGLVAGQLRDALAVLHSPAAVVRLLACNLAAELLFSLTIWTVLRAFGQEVDLVDAIIINEVVALFAGLVPVPGGVGVTEGALTAGFIAVGVPDEVAFSVAVVYRLITFYLPPMWGYLALRSLREDGFL